MYGKQVSLENRPRLHTTLVSSFMEQVCLGLGPCLNCKAVCGQQFAFCPFGLSISLVSSLQRILSGAWFTSGSQESMGHSLVSG